MGDPLLTSDATLTCPHGGQATIAPATTAAMAGGTVCTTGDLVTIAGCAFTIGPSPSPCLTVQWLTSSATTTVQGLAALTTGSLGLCLNAAQAPQGPVVVSPAQTAAAAT